VKKYTEKYAETMEKDRRGSVRLN